LLDHIEILSYFFRGLDLYRVGIYIQFDIGKALQ
jgi:hypothetical protein